jgi:hypothetical protein
MYDEQDVGLVSGSPMLLSQPPVRVTWNCVTAPVHWARRSCTFTAELPVDTSLRGGSKVTDPETEQVMPVPLSVKAAVAEACGASPTTLLTMTPIMISALVLFVHVRMSVTSQRDVHGVLTAKRRGRVLSDPPPSTNVLLGTAWYVAFS